MHLSNFSLSSALSIASLFAPIISTECFSSIPLVARSKETLSPVWPPIVGKIASGFSFSIIFSSVCQFTGSI